jgi:hypothetical protein
VGCARAAEKVGYRGDFVRRGGGLGVGGGLEGVVAEETLVD